ncbi:hypothetical protein CZP2022_223 [Vibrio phage C-ZP2022]|nr:hypothetical protein CZP2022_223 [Vibrio phage C-ZP2022]
MEDITFKTMPTGLHFNTNLEATFYHEEEAVSFLLQLLARRKSDTPLYLVVHHIGPLVKYLVTGRPENEEEDFLRWTGYRYYSAKLVKTNCSNMSRLRLNQEGSFDVMDALDIPEIQCRYFAVLDKEITEAMEQDIDTDAVSCLLHNYTKAIAEEGDGNPTNRYSASVPVEENLIVVSIPLSDDAFPLKYHWEKHHVYSTNDASCLSAD